MSTSKTPGHELRCPVCRHRSLMRGGQGRADRLGTIAYDGTDEGGVVFRSRPRSGRGAGLPPARRDDTTIDVGRHSPDELLVGLEAAAAERWRCRRGHRLRFDAADVRRQLERGRRVVYLEAA